jgi:hypothetical protein
MAAAKELYAEYIASIRDGFIPFEMSARHLAAANHLPLDPLEIALDEAYSRLLNLYIDEIQHGRLSFAEPAYEIAKRRKYSTDGIKRALVCAARASTSSR